MNQNNSKKIIILLEFLAILLIYLLYIIFIHKKIFAKELGQDVTNDFFNNSINNKSVFTYEYMPIKNDDSISFNFDTPYIETFDLLPYSSTFEYSEGWNIKLEPYHFNNFSYNNTYSLAITKLKYKINFSKPLLNNNYYKIRFIYNFNSLEIEEYLSSFFKNAKAKYKDTFGIHDFKESDYRFTYEKIKNQEDSFDYIISLWLHIPKTLVGDYVNGIYFESDDYKDIEFNKVPDSNLDDYAFLFKTIDSHNQRQDIIKFRYDIYKYDNFINDVPITTDDGSIIISDDKDPEMKTIYEEYHKKVKENQKKGIIGTIEDIFDFLLQLPSHIYKGFIKAIKSSFDILFSSLADSWNAFISLFIPNKEQFTFSFNKLSKLFTEKFSIIFYPFELIIDVLNRFFSIKNNTIINIPTLVVPIFNIPIIQAQSFNLGGLWSNGIFKTLHNIYFLIFRVIISFSLINYFRRVVKKLVEGVKNNDF